MRFEKKQLWFLLAALVAGMLRWHGLMRYGLEWDEAHLLEIAMLPLTQLLRVGSFFDHHPPGMALLLHGWIMLFGSSDLAVRLFTWTWGMLGLWMTYALALELTHSRRVAWFTFALSVCSVMLLYFSQIVTFYSPHYAGVLCSWWLFLRWCDSKRARWYWLYAVVTVVTMYMHSAGAVFLSGQGVYLALRWRAFSPSAKRAAGAMSALLLLAYSPYLWLLFQPWHMSHWDWPYPIIFAGYFLLAPANMTLLGYETRKLQLLPSQSILLLHAMVAYFLLLAGWRVVLRMYHDLPAILFCMAAVPMLLLYAVSLLFHVGVFQFRAVLFAVFVFHLMWAIWISRRQTAIAFGILVTLIALQLFSPYRFQPGEDTGKWMAEAALQQGFQPGDGVVVYPGWMSPVFLRYFDPPAFGFSEIERQIDPVHENYFTMIQRIDDRYFLVSGRSVLYRPDVRAAFENFQKKHRRLWLMVDAPEDIKPLLDCHDHYMIWMPDGRFHGFRCVITGAGAAQSGAVNAR